MRNPSFARWSIAFGVVLFFGGLLLGLQSLSASDVGSPSHCGSAFFKATPMLGAPPAACTERRESRRLAVELLMLFGAAFFVAGMSVNDRRIWDGSSKDGGAIGSRASVPEPEPAREPGQA